MSTSLAMLAALVAGFLGATGVEYRRHQRRVRAIPHRIHVNGTRGKSSVTRLIGAGLRAGRVATITKVTGTFPRLILADGSDVPVHRKAAATILEQLNIVDFAAARGTEALVIECMALDPSYQRITEEQMIHATLTVFTNIRIDHTDVMGRTLEEIGASMANTMPRGGTMLAPDDDHIDLVRRLAAQRGTTLDEVPIDDLPPGALDGFSYIEHRANVALALAVCARLGVDRPTALAGMWAARPDAGVLTRATVAQGDRRCTFYNAFAANDPDSTRRIWTMLGEEGHLAAERFVLLNSRPDRQDRSEQLAHLVATALDADAVFVMGAPTDAVIRILRGLGMPADRLVELDRAAPSAVYRAILDRTRSHSSVVAIGNMGGFGAATVDYFDQRSQRPHD
ncbi:MAG: poly-gamma-glutamate synthase PgsB [Acidobacteriota bacterium]